MTSPFAWQGKPSVFVTDSEKNKFNGINERKKVSSSDANFPSNFNTVITKKPIIVSKFNKKQ